MVAAVAGILGMLFLIALLYDSARLISPRESRLPPVVRLRGRVAALEAAESWCVGLLLNGRIDARTYQDRMARLARQERPVQPSGTPPGRC